jgi:hypothetical protein
MSIKRAFFDAPIQDFVERSTKEIIGEIQVRHSQSIEHEQTIAWQTEIELLKRWFAGFERGHLFLEFAIPRMGKRADAVLLIDNVIFVIEFKVGATTFSSQDRRQAEGYALDLKNFHLGSHEMVIVPILLATSAPATIPFFNIHDDQVYDVVLSNGRNLKSIIEDVLTRHTIRALDPAMWSAAGYRPTPTIIEAAQALYADHSVENIARNDAGAKNLAETSERLKEIIHRSRIERRKSICFVTGVPGSGKTLVGLNLATSTPNDEHAVFLSGNGPLVEVLREALARDEAARTPGMSKQDSFRQVTSFIQNIHHFRDEALKDDGPPDERVVVFDEAQRAWDRKNTSVFMAKKHGLTNFHQSEPEFLLNYMNRQPDWCVVVALIGTGQEIDSGEAGVKGWLSAVGTSFTDWDVYLPDAIDCSGAEVGSQPLVEAIDRLSIEPALYLTVSMRSFRSELVSSLIEELLVGDSTRTAAIHRKLSDRYPIRLTRDLKLAKRWIGERARGNESKGFIAHSKAHRLRADGVYVMRRPRYAEIIHWYLAPPDDVRSSHMLEEVATEYEIQGLEIDWLIVGWDANYRFGEREIESWKFVGNGWKRILDLDEQRALVNSYRVLLTRARQGMVIYVPRGSSEDETRHPAWYDAIFYFLQACGIQELESSNADSSVSVNRDPVRSEPHVTVQSLVQQGLFSIATD